jgi:DNA-binding response OmpR family regulator
MAAPRLAQRRERGVVEQSSGRVLTREWLLEQVWGREYDGEDRSVDACVMRLREHLGRDSAVAHAIEAVRGVGYRLHPQGR